MLYQLTVLHFLHVDNAGCLSSLSCCTKLGLKSTSEICKTQHQITEGAVKSTIPTIYYTQTNKKVQKLHFKYKYAVSCILWYADLLAVIGWACKYQ